MHICITVCTPYKAHVQKLRMCCISDKSSLANHGGVSTFETQPSATCRMSKIIWHICFSSVQQCSHSKRHIVKTNECSTTCERCSLKVMNVLYLGHTPWPRKCVRKSASCRRKIKLLPRKQKTSRAHFGRNA